MNAIKIKEKVLKNGYLLEAGENHIELIKYGKCACDFKSFCIKDTKNKKLISELRKRFYRFAEKEKCIIQSEDSERDKKQTEFLNDCGFVIKYSKQVFLKNLVTHDFLYHDIFKYRSIDKTGMEKFFEVFRASVDNPIRTLARFKRYIHKIKREYKNKDGISNWMLVFLNRKPIGIIMPFKILTYMPPRFSKLIEVGTLLNIALLPEEREKRYGRIIHSRGLMILKDMGLKTYMGSTETNNHAMLKVFKLNKCRKSMIQHFYCAKK